MQKLAFLAPRRVAPLAADGTRRAPVMPRPRGLASACAVAAALAAALLPCASVPARAAAEKATMADWAADLVGINTHINYRGSIYDLRFGDIIRPRLLELGVRYIRDNPGDPEDLGTKQRFADLGQNGVRTLMINASLADKEYVKSINALAGMNAVTAVESPNERDLTPNWQGPLRDFQVQMYAAYRGDPETRGIKVLGPSFANTRDSPPALAGVFSGASASMDRGNLHNYSGVHPESSLAGGWGITLPDSLQRYRSLAGSDTLWVTENGYKMSGSVFGFPVVTERAAAKYLPRQFLMHLRYGVRKYFIYQLINNREDFGILNNGGSPRPQYYAVKNFITMFKDPGPTFATRTIDYTLRGNTANIEHALFQKRNGRFYLVLWQGVDSCACSSESSLRDIEPPARNLTLNLGTRFRQARVYRPSFSMQPTGTYSNAGGIASLPLAVPDHILVIELLP